jgi:hypothetical protein
MEMNLGMKEDTNFTQNCVKYFLFEVDQQFYTTIINNPSSRVTEGQIRRGTLKPAKKYFLG